MSPNRRLVVMSVLLLLMIAAACGDGSAATTRRTAPTAPPDIDPCTLLTVAEAETLMGMGLTDTRLGASCEYAAEGTEDVLRVELTAAPNGMDDLAEQRRLAEAALGLGTSLENVGDGAYFLEAGDGFQLRFVVDQIMVTIGVALAEPLAPDMPARAEDAARTIAGRL